MSDQLGRFNRVRYTLYGKSFGVLENIDPKGWSEDKIQLIRSEKYDGITESLNESNLEFYKDAFFSIKSEYDIYGIKGVTKIERESRNENSDKWEVDYVGYLDYTTYKQSKNFISIGLKENEFFTEIEANMKEDFELERLTDLKGNAIPALTYRDLSLKGIDIFRETLYDNEEKVVKALYKGTNELTYLFDFAIPLYLKYESDDNFVEPLPTINSANYLNVPLARIIRDWGDTRIYNAGTVFYLIGDKAKNLTIKINIGLKAMYNSAN